MRSIRYDRRAVRRLRARTGLDLQGLADRMGTSKAQIWMLDSGRQEPRASTLAKIAAALDVSVADFFVDTRGKEAVNGPRRGAA